MALFKNRPLLCASLLFVLTVTLAYFMPFIALIILSSLLLLALALFLFRLRREGLTYPRLLALLLLVAMLLGAGRVLVDRLFTHLRWESHEEEYVSAWLVVKEVDYSSRGGAQVLVRVKDLEGSGAASLALFRCDGAFPFAVGDTFFSRVQIKSLSYDAYYEGVSYQYLSRGARCILLEAGESTLIKSGAGSLAAGFEALRAALAGRIQNALEGEGGRLLSAMLLGERSALADSTVRDFRRSGVSHLLALSGLHLTLLVGMLEGALVLCRVRRRSRIFIILPFCVFYLFLTGCGFSMLRAVGMLLLFYLSFLARKSSDALTTLLFCAALITFFSPAGVFSTALQMTVLSTFGILSFGQFQKRLSLSLARWRAGRIVSPILSSLFTTLSATLFLLPVQWLTFGEMSLIAPLSNLLLVPLALPLLISAILLLFLPFSVIAFPSGVISGMVLSLVKGFSSLDGVVSLEYAFVPYVLLPAVAVTLFLLILDLKGRVVPVLLPSLVGALAFAICFSFVAQGESLRLDVLYRRSGGQEGIVLMHGGKALILDNSNGTLTQLKGDWQLAKDAGATEVEALMLTHYHTVHATSVPSFFGDVLVRELWLPQPLSHEDGEVYDALVSAAEAALVPVRTYAYGKALSPLGDGKITVSAPLFEERSLQGAYQVTVAFGADAFSYESAAYGEYMANLLREPVREGNYFVFGAHGPVPHALIEPAFTERAECVVCGDDTICRLLFVGSGVQHIHAPSTYRFVLK